MKFDSKWIQGNGQEKKWGILHSARSLCCRAELVLPKHNATEDPAKDT
jgi:hypothetical protein